MSHNWLLADFTQFIFLLSLFFSRAPKAAIRRVLAAHTVAMVTNCVAKIIRRCLPISGWDGGAGFEFFRNGVTNECQRREVVGAPIIFVKLLFYVLFA